MAFCGCGLELLVVCEGTECADWDIWLIKYSATRENNKLPKEVKVQNDVKEVRYRAVVPYHVVAQTRCTRADTNIDTRRLTKTGERKMT